MNEKVSLEYDSTLTEPNLEWSKKIQLTEYPIVNQVWEEIISLAMLADNWDSYGAIKPKRKAILGAMQLSQLLLRDPTTPKPSVIPVSNGNIQIEWSCSDIDLEMEISSESSISAYFEDYREPAFWEEEFEYDLTRLSKAIALITDRNSPKLKLVS